MHIDSPWAFLLLLVIPALFALRWRYGRRGTMRFSTTVNAGRAGRSLRQRLLWLPHALRVAALALLTVGLARPQQGRERVRDISKGVAMEMVVDRSSSMGSEMEYDRQRLNRLEVVKRVFEKFVHGDGNGLKGRPNDLIGMIGFARYPDTICPLTLGHGALSEFLKGMKLAQPRSAEDGTAIGDALALAAARLKTAEETLARQTGEDRNKYEIKSKIIILLTDGAQTAGKRAPLQGADLAAKWGIKVYAIGVGGAEGVARSRDPFFQFLQRMGSGVDERTLEAIAERTGGLFRMAESAEALQEIYMEIDRLERTEIESVRYMDYREVFAFWTLAALLALALETALGCTVFRRIP
ncbi:MAG: VWA domain-containing protein [Kiritimatiellae bacterium]|nr:VWA domain-containing protein [Kiritimatiellia bacterium]